MAITDGDGSFDISHVPTGYLSARIEVIVDSTQPDCDTMQKTRELKRKLRRLANKSSPFIVTHISEIKSSDAPPPDYWKRSQFTVDFLPDTASDMEAMIQDFRNTAIDVETVAGVRVTIARSDVQDAKREKHNPQTNLALGSDIIAHLMASANEPDGIAIWRSIATAIAITMGAQSVNLYLNKFKFKQRGTRLQRVHPDPDLVWQVGGPPSPFTFQKEIRENKSSEDIVVQALNRRNSQFRKGTGVRGSEYALAVSIPLEGIPEPLAILLLKFDAANTWTAKSAEETSKNILSQIWPLCLSASSRIAFTGIDPKSTDNVLESILTCLCGLWGFDFASISLCDESHSEIWTIRAIGEATQWMRKGRHPLSEDYIQSIVVRDVTDLEARNTNPQSQDPSQLPDLAHNSLVRLFVPLTSGGVFGVLEVGFREDQNGRSEIDPDLKNLVLQYVRNEASPALRYALLIEEKANHSRKLSLLHDNLNQLEQHAASLDETSWLHKVALSAQLIFKTDTEPFPIVVIHTLANQAQSLQPPKFNNPITAGKPNDSYRLSPPDENDNFISIIQNDVGYYQPFAERDKLLFGDPSYGPAVTFSKSKHVRSFAGYPLEIEDCVMGAVCVNFTHYNELDETFRLTFEIFCQQVAAMLHHSRAVRERERIQFSDDLHDGVKQNLLAIHSRLNAAEESFAESDWEPQAIIHSLDTIRTITNDVAEEIDYMRDGYQGNAGSTRTSFHSTLIHIVESFQVPPTLRVEYTISEELPILDSRTQFYVGHILKSALSNAVQHASARHIQVEVIFEDQVLSLTVNDDGIGFTPVVKENRGLSISQRKAKEIDGMLTVKSGHGDGTKVQFLMKVEA